MTISNSDYPLVIIGAGAAGLGASERATRLNIEHRVIEASHRIGGRGLTEMLANRYPVDLGCHWMHSASLNPYVDWADRFEFGYQRDGDDFGMHFNGDWLGEKEKQAFNQYADRMNTNIFAAAAQGRDCSLWDAIDHDSRWTSQFVYWLSLMHSCDADQVSVHDMANYTDTDEDWPLEQGYGALIAAQGADAPVSLNCAVRAVDWRSDPIVIKTNQGNIRADRVLITVSTAVLGAGDIRFTPQLPGWKQDAISSLPLGNSNYIFCTFDELAIPPDTPDEINWQGDGINFWIRLRSWGMPYLFTSTGGRFAWWLEKQGQQASIDLVTNVVADIFGNDIRPTLDHFKVSAWGSDPWIRGAYSAALPGKGGSRANLAQEIDERLYFAGEATSSQFFSTAHGAYLSGHDAVEKIAANLPT